MNIFIYFFYFLVSLPFRLFPFLQIGEEVSFKEYDAVVFVSGVNDKTYWSKKNHSPFRGIKDYHYFECGNNETLEARALQLYKQLVKKKEWTNEFEGRITLVGHGLGGNVIIKFLEMLQSNQTVDGKKNSMPCLPIECQKHTLDSIEKVVFMSTPVEGIHYNIHFKTSLVWKIIRWVINLLNYTFVTRLFAGLVFNVEPIEYDSVYTDVSKDKFQPIWNKVMGFPEKGGKINPNSILGKKIQIMHISTQDTVEVNFFRTTFKWASPFSGLVWILSSMFIDFCGGKVEYITPESVPCRVVRDKDFDRANQCFDCPIYHLSIPADDLLVYGNPFSCSSSVVFQKVREWIHYDQDYTLCDDTLKM
jgi:hypothetical protein